MYKKTLRPAIAMIELIFALVIIGIVLMTAPMLIRTAAKSGYVAAQQEGIHEAASQISMIMGNYWDEQNTLSSSAENVILTTQSTVSDLNDGILRRIGTPQESKRAFIGDMGKEYNATLPASLGSDGANDTYKDDIDDFNGDVNLIEINASDADYIEKEGNITISTSVVYISDAPTSGAYNSSTLTFDVNLTSVFPSTHIKGITATLTSNSGVDELEKTIILHAFSCNIGGTGELGWK